jgi:hypothetical protein
MAVKLSALRFSWPIFTPRKIPSAHFCWGWVDPKAIVWLEVLVQLKTPVTSSGIEPAIFRLVTLASTNYFTAWGGGYALYLIFISRYIFYDIWSPSSHRHRGGRKRRCQKNILCYPITYVHSNFRVSFCFVWSVSSIMMKGITVFTALCLTMKVVRMNHRGHWKSLWN